jgi:hypothetical protein
MAMATTEATIGRALMRLRRVGIDDQGEHLLWPGRFEQLCREGGHRWRQRLFTPWTTLRLFLLQVLNGNVAINALRQLSGLSFAAGSYCEARTRLPLAALQRLLAELCDAALHQLADDDRRDGGRDGGRDGAGEGGRIYAVDSTGCSLPDTPALRRRFGLPAPARVGVSYPMAMVLGLLDLASGLFVRAAARSICSFMTSAGCWPCTRPCATGTSWWGTAPSAHLPTWRCWRHAGSPAASDCTRAAWSPVACVVPRAWYAGASRDTGRCG